MTQTQDDDVIRWLLEGDAAIRWQVQRDLLAAPAGSVARERRAVLFEGWGARLLALQDAEGTWGGGLYNPKWTSTTYTLLLLRDFGLPAEALQAQRACSLLLEKGPRADGGVNFGDARRSETCITGMVLSLLTYFECDDPGVDTIANHLFERQMPDGGWNCRYPGATHASVHTTISVLEGLRTYALLRPKRAREVRLAQQRACEFLLVHKLFRSHRTGHVIKPEFKRFAFPPRWHYDILRALDYFQSVGAPRDERLAESIDIVRTRRSAAGRWSLDKPYAGKSHFQLERAGAPSRWNTLRALRVLRWWERTSL